MRITRRKVFGALTSAAALGGVGQTKLGALLPVALPSIEIKPYVWEGLYADYRDSSRAKHDAGLCADVRAPWMLSGERIIVRSSEIVGYDSGFLYDDHLPTSEPEGRGRTYHHISFQWDPPRSGQVLSADCSVPGRGRFWLRLQAKSDLVNIELGVRNELPGPMGNIDWHFCVVGLESRSFGDPGRRRTYLFDGKRLRTLAELSGGPKMELFKVLGGNGFIPAGHDMLPVEPVEAKASVVMVESPEKTYTAALGFEQSYTIYGDPIGNQCFHADPYFGPLEKRGEERVRRGKLYLMQGTARDAFDRYNKEFGKHNG